VHVPIVQLAVSARRPPARETLKDRFVAWRTERFSNVAVTVVLASTSTGVVAVVLTARSTAGSTVSCSESWLLAARSSGSVVVTDAFSIPAPTAVGVVLITIV
jgi:hypothetical protein